VRVTSASEQHSPAGFGVAPGYARRSCRCNGERWRIGNCSLLILFRAKGAKFVTRRAEECRRYARRCMEVAPTFQDEEARATLLDLAQAWLRLAHLALANRHIAELTVQIARQRAIGKHALDTGQGSEMADSLLHALEESLRYSRSIGYFCSVAADYPAPRRRVAPQPAGACHDTTGVERHDQLKAEPIWDRNPRSRVPALPGDSYSEMGDVCLGRRVLINSQIAVTLSGHGPR
jgi:hypothetical protein